MQLNPSPLEVHSQFFWETNLTASREPEPGAGDLDVERRVIPMPDVPNGWRVILQLRIVGVEGEKEPPYLGQIVAEGQYSVHEKYPHDPERLIRITGSSMLYGVIREMIATVTARGPHGMLTLPSVSFFENEKDPVKKTPAKKTAKKVSKTTKKGGPKKT